MNLMMNQINQYLINIGNKSKHGDEDDEKHNKFWL